MIKTLILKNNFVLGKAVGRSVALQLEHDFGERFRGAESTQRNN